MAKGARSSVNKANNVRLKNNVFGPVETARTERLSAKLLELASQPKPKPAKEDIAMDIECTAENSDVDPASKSKQIDNMEIDQDPSKLTTTSKSGRIEKKTRHRSSRKASIVFPGYKDGKRISRTKAKK